MIPAPENRRDGGVVYAREDCAGLFRRVVSGVIDGLVLLAALLVLGATTVLIRPPALAAAAFVSAWLFAVFGYLAFLKRTRYGTLGYRLAGIRIVDLCGRAPSPAAMCLRCALLVAGQGLLLVDLIYLLGDLQRRKLSDTLAGTRVVRAAARPVGYADVVPAILFVLGHAYFHRDIRPIDPSPLVG